MRASKMPTSDFLSISYCFRVKRGQNHHFEGLIEFLFSSNFDGIFFIGFLSMRALKMPTVDFSISYRFRVKRD